MKKETPQYASIESNRQFTVRVAIAQFMTLPYDRLRYRNLREDFHAANVVPHAYLSYSCGQKAVFRERGSLRRTIDQMIDVGDLVLLSNNGVAKVHSLKVDSKSTLYTVGEMFGTNYGFDIDDLKNNEVSFDGSFRFSVVKLDVEARESCLI